MKKKMLISLVACFIAAGSFVQYNFADNNQNMNFTLADISVMAQADGESGSGDCSSWGYRNWNYQYSEIDGVDCGCTDRSQVILDCP